MEKQNHIVVMIPGMAYYQAAQYGQEREPKKHDDVSVVFLPPSLFPQNIAAFNPDDQFGSEDLKWFRKTMRANAATVAVLGIFFEHEIPEHYLEFSRFLLKGSCLKSITYIQYRDKELEFRTMCRGESLHDTAWRIKEVWPRVITYARRIRDFWGY